ncbi:hypothetical protein N480_12385 [Pseudoalteromonas luteoviolacea S2607]|nr:hypothetical protein N480_12385 [Pseudoalteromonas luteoviolacea S2607]
MTFLFQDAFNQRNMTEIFQFEYSHQSILKEVNLVVYFTYTVGILGQAPS